MGELIQLPRRRELARRRSVASVTFFFDLACPYTYLAAERIDRRFAEAQWRPAAGRHLATSPCAAAGLAGTRAIEAAERRAQELHMPLVWPERFPATVPAAMRAATYASERGHGAAFAIAVGRLAFCGGFDVDDPRMLAEAAAAAGLDVEETLAAARDERRDRLVDTAGRSLWVDGSTSRPALRFEGRSYEGERSITSAMFAAPAVVFSTPGR
jgi:2-hydroxychromene-2-carboxylate isomerase